MKIIEWNKNGNTEGEQQRCCLFLLPRSLFPVVSGYSNKNVHLLPFLSKQFRLHLMLLTDRPIEAEEQAFYKQNNIWVTECRFSKAEHALGATLAVLNGKPLQVGYYYNRQIQKYVDQCLEKSQKINAESTEEVAIAGLIRTAEYLLASKAAGFQQKKRYFDMVDSIGYAYQRSVQTTKSVFWRQIYRFEAKRLLRYEQRAVAAFDNTFFINREEEQRYREYGKTAWLHHGVKEELFHYTKIDERYRHHVAFLGKMNYQPNIDAVRWYIEQVHAGFRGEVPFLIIGAYPAPELQKLAQKYAQIELTGYCEDPYLYLNSAMAVVAPMQSGGGIQNKVLEAMALGKIVLLTRLAAEAITGAKDGVHFLVAERAEDYKRLLLDIRENPEAYSGIGHAAQALIRENYTWDHYCREYLQAL